LFSRYGYVSRDRLTIPRKSKRREKSRAGMVRTYSGSTPRVKAKEGENRPKMKDLAKKGGE
jgi:hypothetical protein